MNTKEFKFEIGDTLKDRVTGLKGVVMVRAHYATGCAHYGLAQKQKADGTVPDWVWLDGSQLDLKKTIKRVKFDVSGDGTSGPMPSGPQL